MDKKTGEDQYQNSWGTNMIFKADELEGSYVDNNETYSAGYYDSSSPDGAQSLASKNIVSERNRRKKLNERLFGLRAVVPNISKMDKASIVKDAIEYIKELHEQERTLQGEISKLKSVERFSTRSSSTTSTNSSATVFDFDQETAISSKPKKTRIQQYRDFSVSSRSTCIEVLELRVSYMGEKTVVISLTCKNRGDTMVKLCEIFESLKLRIITANITAFSGRLLKTVFIEADEKEKDDLQIKIERAIAASNDPDSPVSICAHKEFDKLSFGECMQLGNPTQFLLLS